MAILKNGPNGGFSGKVGSVVGVMRLGTAIIRGWPKLSKKNKIGTPAQRASRSLFTKMQYFLSPVLGFIRVGFNHEGKSKNRTAHNAAKSYNMLHAFDAHGEIDYSRILLSFGNLPGAQDLTVAKDDAGVHFTWAYNIHDDRAGYDDQVMLLVYDPESNQAQYILSGARRKAKTETLEIYGLARAKTLHAWIAFVSDNREQISMSTYVGTV